MNHAATYSLRQSLITHGATEKQADKWSVLGAGKLVRICGQHPKWFPGEPMEVMGVKDTLGAEGLTHGCCARCMKEELKEHYKKHPSQLIEYMNSKRTTAQTA